MDNILLVPGMDVVCTLLVFLLGAATTLMGNEIKDIQGKREKLVYFSLMIIFFGIFFYLETKTV